MRALATVALLVVATSCSSPEPVVAEQVATAAPTPSVSEATTPAIVDATVTPPPPSTPAPTPAPPVESTDGVEFLRVEVLETYPHDTDAFTQGLEVLPGGSLIESTGLEGESDLREVELATGAVERIVATPENDFAEGVTLVDDRFIQLTWTEQTAYVWDAATFELERSIPYEGEGWGLCYDGIRLIMSNGSDALTFRDPESFAALGSVTVTYEGQPLANLNELECVGGQVWANVWLTDFIVRIDPDTGVVTAVVDATTLERPDDADVLNGIAYDAVSDTFLVTGKEWPTLYRVEFVTG